MSEEDWDISEWECFEKDVVSISVNGEALKQKKNLDLTKITDVWTQSVICYYLWLHFGREIPHNDLADFFTCTDQIREWICL